MPTTIRPDDQPEARHAHLAQKTGCSRSRHHKEALEEAANQLEHENELLTDAADYRAGRARAYALDEVGEMLELDR